MVKEFPIEERYSLTDQIRRSSRSVCANLAEAWRKRRYKAAFIAKLSDSEAALKDTASHKAAEVQVWLKFAVECGYIEIDVARSLYKNTQRFCVASRRKTTICATRCIAF